MRWLWEPAAYESRGRRWHRALATRYPGWRWDGAWPIAWPLRLPDETEGGVRWGRIPEDGGCLRDTQGPVRWVMSLTVVRSTATVDTGAMRCGWPFLWRVLWTRGMGSAWLGGRLLHALPDPTRLADRLDRTVGVPSSPAWVPVRDQKRHGR